MPQPKREPMPASIPGFTALQRAFKGHETAEAVARRLGYEITTRVNDGITWLYIPSDAVGEILAVFSRWEQDHRAARTVTKQHVSARLLDLCLRFNSLHFARRLEAAVVRPTESETEEFVLIEDIPLICAEAAAGQPGFGWRTSPADAEAAVAWIAERELAGVSERDARRRKLLPSGW